MPPITRKMAKLGNEVISAATGSAQSRESANVTEPPLGLVPHSTGPGDAAAYHPNPDSLAAGTSAPPADPESQLFDPLQTPLHTELTPPLRCGSTHTKAPSQSENAPRPTRGDVSNGSRHRSTRTVASAASIQARKLAIEAEFQRKRLERDRTIAEQERQRALAELERERALADQLKQRERALADLEHAVEEKELQAQLAAIEARSDKSLRSRSYSSNSASLADTQAWVEDCAARHVHNFADRPHNFTDTLRPQPPHGTPIQDPMWRPQGHVMNAQPHYCPAPVEQSFPQAHVMNSQLHRPAPAEYLLPRAENTTAAHHIPNAMNAYPMQAPSAQLQCLRAQDPSLATALHALASSQNQRSSKYIELPPFTGKTNEWLIFKRTFDDTKPNYSALDNLARLRNAVRGEACEALSSLLFSAESPSEIVDALELHFARPELIVQQEVLALRGLPKLSTDYRDLNKFACKIRNSVATIKSLKQIQYLHSPELFSSVLNKLNALLKSRWCDYAKKRHQTSVELNSSKLELLSQFLLGEADTQLKFCAELEAFPPTNHLHTHQHTPTHKTFRATGGQNFRSITKRENVNLTSERNQTCLYCKEIHNLKSCVQFKALSVDDRWRWLREAKVCYVCFKNKPHKWNECRGRGMCGVQGCRLRHHPLLHRVFEGAPNTSQRSEQDVTCNTDVISAAAPPPPTQPPTLEDTHGDAIKIAAASDISNKQNSGLQERTLLKVVPVVVSGPAGECETYAFLDDGSTATLIDDITAARIGATGPLQPLSIAGIGGMTRNTVANIVDFYIKGRNSNERYLIKNAKRMQSLNLSTQSIYDCELRAFPHLSDLANELSHVNVTPTILIGSKDWYLTLCREAREGKRSDPVAVRTLLGWTLHGAVSSKSKPVEFINHLTWNGPEFINHAPSSPDPDSTHDFENLTSMMKAQYKLDALGITERAPRLSKDDERALQILESTTRRLPSGHFEVGLPWRDIDKLTLPDSYPHALARFLSLEKQIAKNKEFATAYRDFINGIIKKGYAEECAPDTYHRYGPKNGKNSFRWYLPHFGVYHPQKKKLRVVHDAAAETAGISLNALLLAGPDLLCSLLDILFQFREGQIALTADIREMFPQIKIREDDRDAQRFLWRDNSSDSIKEYRMSSMTFGAASSPCTALFIKNKNAEEHRHLYPEAARAIVHEHYMDDYIGSVPDVTDAVRLASEIAYVHKACGFEMRAWISNDVRALSQVPKALWAEPAEDVDLPPNKDISALGIKWNPRDDTFGFRVGAPVTNTKLTKRTVLSDVMRVYDPLGLISPITIKGRIFIQRLWRERLNWDDEISSKHKAFWDQWREELAAVVNLRVPRWYLLRPDPLEKQLHVFADASEEAFVSVAYWRFRYANGDVKLSLIASKARVSPLAPVSIPRLELQAALIAARLANKITEGHRLKPSLTFYWTDSMTVVKWLRSDAKCFKPFVANRVGEISETTDIAQWRWLPSAHNVADDATRSKPMSVDASHRWFIGPPFLLSPPEAWPTEPQTDDTTPFPEEMKSTELVNYTSVPLDQLPPVANVTKFSSWLRFTRATARIIQAGRKFRSLIRSQNPKSISTSNNNHSFLTATDIAQAERHIFIRSQAESFTSEIASLKSAIPLPKESRLTSFTIRRADDGLLLVDSRIARAPGIAQETKTPIILDAHHPAVRLLIRDYHVKAGHGYNDLVLNELRQRFWILRCRNALKTIVRECFYCKRMKGQPQVPPTGDIPVERLEHHLPPFANTGLDYFGPQDVTVGRRKEKRWVALFTCLVTRAVHLEVVGSLSADSAILCLRRFISRRGSPKKLFSDNSTAFRGADNLLAPLFDYAAHKKIEWHFIPPASPFMGGAWERLVRCVKTALYAALRERAPREEVFATLIAEAEAIVNSRPLTYVSLADPDCPTAITPFHFLIGTSSNNPWLAEDLDDSDLVRRCDWRRTLRLADLFWSRWVREYLPTLIPRPSARATTNLKEGDVVLIVDGSLPRGTWPLGKIIKIYPGQDGIVRVVDVATQSGTLRRPTRKVVVLTEEPQPAADAD